MNGALEILRRERDEATDQIRTLRLRIKDLETAIAVLEGQPIHAKNPRSAGDLKLSVLGKLEELGTKGATPKELADAFTADGRSTTDASVSSTLSRLKSDLKVVNRSGRWFATSNGSAEPTKGASETKKPWDDDDDDTPF